MAKDQLKPRKLVLIGGSAGALAIVLQIIARLKKDMNVSVLIVLHRKSSEENVLLDVITSKTDCEVREVEDKDELLPGSVYIAPADYHVLIERDGTLALDDSEKVHFSRPSIDVSFESAAEIYGPSLLCVLLSGANADGVAGLVATKARGGVVVIQDPDSAEFVYMPKVATQKVTADLLLKDTNIDSLLELIRS
jgi:two-component system chemotaxis response regulator CheB